MTAGRVVHLVAFSVRIPAFRLATLLDELTIYDAASIMEGSAKLRAAGTLYAYVQLNNGWLTSGSVRWYVDRYQAAWLPLEDAVALVATRFDGVAHIETWQPPGRGSP